MTATKTQPGIIIGTDLLSISVIDDERTIKTDLSELGNFCSLEDMVVRAGIEAGSITMIYTRTPELVSLLHRFCSNKIKFTLQVKVRDTTQPIDGNNLAPVEEILYFGCKISKFISGMYAGNQPVVVKIPVSFESFEQKHPRLDGNV